MAYHISFYLGVANDAVEIESKFSTFLKILQEDIT